MLMSDKRSLMEGMLRVDSGEFQKFSKGQGLLTREPKVGRYHYFKHQGCAVRCTAIIKRSPRNFL